MELSIFISVMVPLVGGVLWLISLQNAKSTLNSTRLNYVEQKAKDDKEVYDNKLKAHAENLIQDQADIKALKEQRHKDFLEFTKVLGEFSNSLTKFELTMKHLDETLKEVKAEIRNNNKRDKA